jgi:hypothetical protein
MPATLDRPVALYDPAKSLLKNDHFQLGYVTNDVAEAEALFRERFGVTKFRCRDNELPNGASVSTRTVWIGAMMYEIACGKGPGMEQFSRYAPSDGRVLAFHHFGYLVPGGAAAWRVLEAQLASGGWEVIARNETPGFGRTCMVDAPELGHRLEYIQLGDMLAEQMNSTPHA